MKLIFSIFFALFLCLSALANNYSFPQSATYDFGIKPTALKEDMNQACQTAFIDWKTNYLTTEGCPAGAYRVHRSIAYDYDTVSEGIAWGMLICVLMENETNLTKKYFDGLWQYYQSYLNEKGLMSWKISRTGEITGKDSATEANENVAMALLYASKQWTDYQNINYYQEARKIISQMMSHEVERKTFVLKPGSSWGGYKITNPAYYDLAYYRIWKKIDPDWQNVIERGNKTYDYFYNNYQTGLYPDWCVADGTKTHLSYNFTYDACQVPLKQGIDYLWNGEGKKYLNKFTDWLAKKTDSKPAMILDGYRLEGMTIGKYHNAAFVGPACIAAMSAKNYQYWLDLLYEDLVNSETGGTWGYYPDTIRLISLLIVSGNMPNHWKPIEDKDPLLWQKS